MQDAAKIKHPLNRDASLLPLISFGQLPLPGGKKDRIVRLKFVFDSSFIQEKEQYVIQEITKIFKNVRMSEMVQENNLKVVNMDIKIDGDIPRYICGLTSRLADLHIRAVLVGEYGMGIGGSPPSGSQEPPALRLIMNPEYNLIYSFNAVDKAENFIPTYFSGSLDRGGEPYFCPNGWRRYGINFGMSSGEFETKYGDWPVAYHGTRGHFINKILMNGLRASGENEEIRCPNLEEVEGRGAVFLSPSIEYCGHPYYANVWKVKSKYVQMVLQVRVDRKRIFKRIEGTIPGAFATNRVPVDPNFENNSQLEWIVRWPPFTPMTAMDGLVVYGIMLRVTNKHPGLLQQNRWWYKSNPERWDYF